jgi:anionic cell wall polymer biosynthesis LytR-Cps2A-Psr (LCP) family protein
MVRQQQFLGSLVSKVQSSGVLLNPTRLLPVLDAATKSLTTDPGLDSLKDLYDLTRRMRDIPSDKVQFMTLPRMPYADDANRDELLEPDAANLFGRLRKDLPITLVPPPPASDAPSTEGSTDPADEDGGSSDDEKAGDPTPGQGSTFTGTSAAVGMCG